MEWVSKLSKAKLSKARIIVFCGVAGWFVLSVIFGMEIGRSNSPDYSNQRQTAQFILTNYTKDEVSDADVKMHVVAGPYRWDYSLSADSVKQKFDPILLRSMRSQKRWSLFEQDRLEKLAGLPSAPTALAALFQQMRKTKSKKAQAIEFLTAGGVIAIVGMLATGGIIGYFLTYSDKADYDNEVFQKVMMNKDIWHTFAETIRECVEKPEFSEECKKWERAN